jgi:hypothetical protein
MSLIVSIVAAVILLAAEEATNSKALFFPQLPGYFAAIAIWGVHGGERNAAVFIVFSAANALVYWPIVFGLSFLLRNKGSN